ncbi:MAG TPA: hypothetical protein VF796_20025, partial [Humisphaera sp.]
AAAATETAATHAPPTGSTADSPIAKELDHVFEQQVTAAAAAGPTAEPLTAPAQPDAATAEAVGDLLGRLDAGERPHAPDANATPAEPHPAHPADTTGPAPAPAASVTIRASHADPPDGTIARILTGVLDPFPDGVRDAIGKVAIVTAVNAIAVLLYVLFFRK